MDNIIQFPIKNSRPIITNEEQMAEAVSNMRLSYIDLFVEDIVYNIVMRTQLEGFDITSEQCTKTTALMYESIRGALLKSIDMEHPLHELAEKHVFINQAEHYDDEEQ